MPKKPRGTFEIALGFIIIIGTLLIFSYSFTRGSFGWVNAALEYFGLLALVFGVIFYFWKKLRHINISASINYSWISLFGFTFCAAYLYIILEWIFIITKPSFLSTVTLLRKLGILFCTSAVLASLAFLGLAVIYIFSKVPWLKKFPKIFLAFACLIPTSIIASMVLLLIDNFTYTLFRFGISTSMGVFRAYYLTGFIFIFIFIYTQSQKTLSNLSSIMGIKTRRFIFPSLLSLIIISFLLTYKNDRNTGSLELTNQSGENKYPNIVLISADDVSADYMSAYGYDRDTTPRIKELAGTSLVAENAFPNSSKTRSSITAIYTSKYPTQTRVLFPPDILKNIDSYQHFPGIMKSMGYYTAEYTDKYWADAYDVNLLSGFDYVNGRSIKEGSFYDFINRNFITDYSYFIYETSNRIINRLEHIFFINQMENQQSIVQGTAETFNDQEKIDGILNLFSETDQPVFVHLHWMGTHGPKYKPNNQVFSAGKNVADQEEWDDDFYSDVILEFDDGVGKIIDFLKSNEIFDNTIIIITSDHGHIWTSINRIPLVIHFPYGQFSGIRMVDVQQLDIAPTLLDYLGIEKPSWMKGDSFLSGELINRPIFSAGIDNVETKNLRIDPASVKPPYYQFGSITVVYCDRWFKLLLTSNQYQTGLVEGHTQPCDQSLVSNDQFITWIIGHLRDTGFDTSILEQEFNK